MYGYGYRYSVRPGMLAFNPANLSGLKLWLDASDPNTINSGNPSNDDPLSTWVDKSPSGNNLTQGTGTLQPLYKSSGFGSRSRPYIDFDGTDDFLSNSDIGTDSELTMFAVVYFDTLNQPAADFDYIISKGDYTTANNFTSIGRFNTDDKLYCFTGATSSKGSAIIGQDEVILSSRLNTSSTYLEMWQDNSSESLSADYSGAPNITGNLEIGRYAGVNHWFNGKLAEVIIYNRAITNDEHTDVLNYINAKYNIY